MSRQQSEVRDLNPAVRLELVDHIGVITLNRPDNRNSMTPELLQCFSEVLGLVRGNSDIRVVVITGSGRCFSAGADFKSNLLENEQERLDHEHSYAMYEPFLDVLDIQVPVIGALSGHAVGGGFGLALLCDIRIACCTSKYGANFTRLGLAPGMSISYLLPRLIGLSRANEMLYSGRLISGEEAEQMGLVSQAHGTPEEVLEAAMQMAKRIAACAPIAVRLTKQSIAEQLEWNPRLAARREAHAQAATLKTQDAQEGIAALLEKRAPVFIGK